MATNYTTNYQLNQWEPADAVQRVEFNQDNAKVDAALKSLSDQVVQKANQSAVNTLITAVNQKVDQSTLDSLAQTVNQKADQTALTAAIATIPNIVAGTYTGDGTQNRKIPLPFTPKAVYVNPYHGWTTVREGNGDRSYWGGLAVQDGPLHWSIEPGWDTSYLKIVSGGFSVSYQSYLSHHSVTNSSDVTYHYLAIG